MDYKVVRHILAGDSVEYIATAHKDSGFYAEDLPDTLVIHYTALGSLESAVSTLRDPNVKASAHLVIGRDGRIAQLIPFNKIAWHAGQSEWRGRTGMNKYSIGIEIDNAGKLSKSGDIYKTWYGGLIPPEDVYYGPHRNELSPAYWHAYTEKQIICVFEVCQVLRDKYGISTIVGHEEISPGRKIDPGPAFPLDKLRTQLLEDRSTDAPISHPEAPDSILNNGRKRGIVTASSLNFRAAPKYHAEPICAPLARDTTVTILKEEKGWYQVHVSQTGWVKKEYIKIID
ncbi:N-acetylmuramoyl-L-alanine amidase [candidate division KSB1 bacterium]|nr:N-acetylmuramoyl-L-alanine amidase [candidate division KSB1 bacterium]